MDGKTLGVDENPHANDDAKAAIQEIVWTLLQRFRGEAVDRQVVEAALGQALTDAGIPEQPQPWMEATAIEIAGGREVVMDVKDQVEPDQVQMGDQTVTVLASPTGFPDESGGPRPSPQERAAE